MAAKANKRISRRLSNDAQTSADLSKNGSNSKKNTIVAAKSDAINTTDVPVGFRKTSTGALIPCAKTCAPAFAASSQRSQRQAEIVAKQRNEQEMAAAEERQIKLRPHAVPKWLRQRKEELQRNEERRLAEEIQRARESELAHGGKKSKPKAETQHHASQQTHTIAKPFISCVDARLAERAEWECRRRAKEEAITAEREKAKRERLRREDEEYREARRKTVPKAHPVPAHIYGS